MSLYSFRTSGDRHGVRATFWQGAHREESLSMRIRAAVRMIALHKMRIALDFVSVCKVNLDFMHRKFYTINKS